MKTRYIFLLISIMVFFLTPNFSCAYSAVQLTAGNNDKVTQVNNPSDILVLVNKLNALPNYYVPGDLRAVKLPSVKGKDQLRDVAATALETMFYDAKKSGHVLYARSGYRSYARQSSIFNSYVKQYGRKVAETFSAPPGMSEHQTGLTMDISSKGANYELIRKFGELPEGKWVKENSWKYGFIIRYPEGKTDITKYTYEPWHLRYVGVEAAKIIYKRDTTLEEYLDSIKWKDNTFAALDHCLI